MKKLSEKKADVNILTLKQFGLTLDRMKYHLDMASKEYDCIVNLRKEVEAETGVRMRFGL